MRKLTAGLFHTVDGAVQSPNLWQFDAFDEELGALLGTTLAATDTVILGRKGYEEWAEFWPNAGFDDEFKTFINAAPKHVASRTLTGQLAWNNSTLIEGDLIDFVRDLKQRPGGEIAVMASISIVRQLFFAGLMEELSLITHPVVAGGSDRHLFEPGDPLTRLELKRSLQTSKGNIVATYGLRA
jgi:dihydrofolate reductase